jgi:hypothetical protein
MAARGGGLPRTDGGHVTQSLIAFLVRGECGDYYCGCGGGHIAAVALTEDEAERLKAEAESATHRYTGGGTEYKMFPLGVTIEKFSVGQLLPRDV